MNGKTKKTIEGLRDRLALSQKPVWGLLLLLAGFHLWTALLGIDYGTHWDEHYMRELLSENVRSLSAWPQKYIYGSLYGGIGNAALAPDWFRAFPRLAEEAFRIGQYQGRVQPSPAMMAVQRELLDVIASDAFLLRLRTLFAFVAVSAIPLMFIAGRRLPGGSLAGIVSASVLAFSWEINTHARHVAVDSTLVAFVALEMAFLMSYGFPAGEGAGRRKWLYCAAATVGLATGTKFPAIALVVPVIVAALATPKTPVGERLKLGLLCLLLCLGASLAVNPALLVDSVQVANDWGYGMRDYNRATLPGIDPYRVTGRWQHLGQALAYLGTSALSHSLWVSLLLDACALAGLAALLKRHTRAALALLSFLPVYLWVVTGSGLMIVRNYLPVLPVIALLAGVGVAALFSRLPGPKGLIALAVFLSVWLGINGTRMATSAMTVAEPHGPAAASARVSRYIAEHDRDVFLVSANVARVVDSGGDTLRRFPNVRTWDYRGTPPPFDYWVYTLLDFRGRAPGAARRAYFTRVLGSQEVNYDYYPDWIGRDSGTRIYIVDRDKAAEVFAAFRR